MKNTIINISLMIFLAPFLFGNANVHAEGNLARQTPITVNLTLTEFAFEPKDLEFETGKLYKLVVRNSGTVKHEIDSATISRLAYTRKLTVRNEKKELIAEIKGVPAEIEIYPEHEIEWWFVPIAATDGGEEVVCLLPGHHEKGMEGSFTFK